MKVIVKHVLKENTTTNQDKTNAKIVEKENTQMQEHNKLRKQYARHVPLGNIPMQKDKRKKQHVKIVPLENMLYNQEVMNAKE